MTIKQQGGIFGRNPTFNDVDVDGTLSIAGVAVPAPANTLVSSDIGVTVQGYDADTTKNDVANTFTADQTISKTTNTTLSVKSIDAGNDRNAKLELLSSGNGASKAVIVYGDTDTTPSTPSPLSFQGYHSGTLTEHIQLTTTGNIKFVNSGNGIDFSATAGTGTSELFDDYETGTWSVTSHNLTITGTPTYTGHYTKIGRIVHVTMRIQATSISSTGGATFINGGFPFVSAAIFTAAPFANSANGDSLGVGLFYLSGGNTIIYTPTFSSIADIAFTGHYYV